MGWERGKYYTRSKRVGGRVQRQYIGRGEVGETAAKMDAMRRDHREAEKAVWRDAKAKLEGLDEQVEAFNDFAEMLAHATLVASGYHLHHRGQWRRRRGNNGQPAE